MGSLIDRTGKRFGRLLVIEQHGRDNNGRVNWLCLCDCGQETVIASRHLPNVQSCGCVRQEKASANGKAGADKLRGSNSPLWKDYVSYFSAHQRVATAKGPACSHVCVDCGKTAWHWSYTGIDPDERIQNGLRYSCDPAFYEPRCVPCHSRFDERERERLAQE